jgi:hypothetical protein
MLVGAGINMPVVIQVHLLIRQRTAFQTNLKMRGLYGLAQVLQTAVGDQW